MAKKAVAVATAIKPKSEVKELTLSKPAGLPAEMGDEFKGMASGLEQVTANDLLIPRISILQALSPQLQKSKPEYIKGAEVGQFCDAGTGQVFEGSIQVIPCFFAKVFLEWAPRATGKGLVHNHGTNSVILEKCKTDEKGRQTLPNGNYIAETATFHVLNLSAGGRRSFIPMTSTQLKASRRWLSLITAEKIRDSRGVEFTPPIFFRSWIATAREQSNAEGTWYGWHLEPGQNIIELDATRSLLTQAKEFYEQARDGLVRGDFATEDGDNVIDGTVNSGSM